MNKINVLNEALDNLAIPIDTCSIRTQEQNERCGMIAWENGIGEQMDREKSSFAKKKRSFY